MTTLITGAGLVGTSFAQAAIKRGEDVVFYDPQPRDEFIRIKLGKAPYKVVAKDVRDLPGLVQAIRDHKVATVVHSAGLIGKRVEESLYTGVAVNVLGTTNVAEAVRLSGVKRLVHVSTFGVYDWRRPAIAATVDESFPRGPGGAYGSFKVAKETILEAYANVCGFELLMVRPANVFGLGHFWSGSGGGEKMQALVEGGLRGETAVILRSQTMENEYIYGKDLGGLIDRAATAPMPKQTVFNAGVGRLTQFDDLIATVKKVIPGLKFQIKDDGPPRSRAKPLDMSAAREHLGWTPQFGLEDAIRDYVADIREVGLDDLGRVRR